MTKSGKSLFYFGIYVVLAGLLFLFVPDSFISLNRLPAMPAGWARVIGLLALVIGTYDILCGKWDMKPIIKASVYVRFGFAAGVTLLVLSGQMPVTLMIFGVMDALGAIWTMTALKSETVNT